MVEIGKITLAKLIEIFSTTWRLHRVPLFDNVGIVSILSQSDIVRYFADHKQILSSLWDLPISGLAGSNCSHVQRRIGWSTD